jgi:Na+-driven multidrug efflux pump
MWVFRVGGSYILALESVSVFGLFTLPGFGLGVLGVWVAMTVDWVFRTVFFTVHYLRGKWLNYRRL